MAEIKEGYTKKYSWVLSSLSLENIYKEKLASKVSQENFEKKKII